MEEQPSILTWKIFVLFKSGWFEVHVLWNWNWKIQGEKNMEKKRVNSASMNIFMWQNRHGQECLWLISRNVCTLDSMKQNQFMTKFNLFIYSWRSAGRTHTHAHQSGLVGVFSSMVMKFLCSLIIDITSSYQCQHETNRSIFESLWIYCVCACACVFLQSNPISSIFLLLSLLLDVCIDQAFKLLLFCSVFVRN